MPTRRANGAGFEIPYYERGFAARGKDAAAVGVEGGGVEGGVAEVEGRYGRVGFAVDVVESKGMVYA